MTPTRLLPATLALAALLAGCLDTGAPDNSFVADYQFGIPPTPEGWSASFADFPASQEGDVGFLAGVRSRPEEIGSSLQALYLRGDNISDDLFMYWFRRIDGFLPNAAYRIGFDVEYISNVSRDCDVGVGPSTWIKAGVVNVAPARVLDQDGWYRMNIDKGQQSQGGATVVNMGDIRNNRVGCVIGAPYGLWARHSGPNAITVTTDANGALWIILGTESGFEVVHDIYFTRLAVRFEPVQ